MNGIPIKRIASGSAEAAFDVAKRRGAKRLDFTRDYFAALYADCAARGIDADVLVAQWDLETGAGTSEYWERDGNPAGLAAFDDGSNWGLTFSPQKAARAHVTHMARYLGMSDVPAAWIEADARWKAVADAGFVGKVTTTSDLGNGRWATDREYGNKLRERYIVYWGEPTTKKEKKTVSLTFGKVPHPAYQDRPIWKAEGVGMNNLGKRTVKGVSWHRILGTLWGTDGFFRDPSVKALTDYGVGVLAQDGADNDGVILRWNDPLGFQSGWASGTWSAQHAYGDGKAFTNKYGINAINRDRASIEISGFQNTALSPKAKQAVAAITAYWADQYGIPWDMFPNSPQDGFSFVVWHEEFGPDFGQKKCPFDVVKAATPEMIEMTAQIMKQYQTGEYVEPQTPDGTKYAAPITYDWLTAEEAAKGLNRVIGETPVYYLPQVYTAIRSTPRKRQASGDEIIGPPIEKDDTFKADYVFRYENTTYVLTPYGTRVRAAHLLPKVQISQRGSISIRRTKDGAPEPVNRMQDLPSFSNGSLDEGLTPSEAAEVKHLLEMRP
jgi:hypothetical protein